MMMRRRRPLMQAAMVGGTRVLRRQYSAAVAGAAEAEDGHILLDTEVWYLGDAIPEGTTAAIALIEHTWAIPLRDKITQMAASRLPPNGSIRPTSRTSPPTASCRLSTHRTQPRLRQPPMTSRPTMSGAVRARSSC